MALPFVLASVAAYAQPADAAISAERAQLDGNEQTWVASDRDPPRDAVLTEEERERGDGSLVLQYGVQFLPDAPGQQAMLRFRGKRDGYFGAELRITPGSDYAWVGRASAGVDVFGKSSWDLDLGLNLGAAGEWSYTADAATLYASPVVGTEVGIGYDGKKFLAKYRWLAAIGAGPLDDLLTEQELTVGFRLFPGLQVYGQWLVLAPGDLPNEAGVGLGARVVF